MTTIPILFVCLLVMVPIRAACEKTESPLIRNVWRIGTHLEGPHWSTEERALYYVDISEQKVHRYDPATGNTTTREIGYGPVTPVVTVKDNPKLVAICVRTEVYFLPWDTFQGDSSLRLLTAIDLGHPDNRCNDGKVDAKGRLWLGTMGKEENGDVVPDQSSVYMVTQDNYIHPEVKVRPVTTSNGIAWSANQKLMYYIDTPTRNVDVFDFNLDTGAIQNRRTIFSFQDNNVTGLPDGMTMDSEGKLWIACFNGGKVIKVDSISGKLIEQHNIPAQKVTSVMWGGADLSTLYVTTSRVDLSPAEMARQPEAGSLFAIEGTGSRGVAENQFLFEGAANF